MSQNTADWILAFAYLTITVVSVVIFWFAMDGIYWILTVPLGAFVRWLAIQWWFWLWTLIYPYLLIKKRLRSRRAKRISIFPPLGINRRSGAERQRLGKPF